MTTKAKTVKKAEEKARKNEGIVVADDAIMELSRERAKIDEKINKLQAEKATIGLLIKDKLKTDDATEIVDQEGKRVWYTSSSRNTTFDVMAMVDHYPILAPLVRRFTKVTYTKKLYFSKPEGS